MLTTLRRRLRELIFLERQAESGEVYLTQRRVFTLPSKAGWMFVLLLLIMFLTATNYSLSLGFALTFLLAGVAILNTFWCFRNLAYLHLRSGSAAAVFVGDECHYTIHLINRRAYARHAISVGFNTGRSSEQVCDIAAHDTTTVQLSCPANQRGWQAIPRIRLQTWFPLGWLRAWSTWLPDSQALVYPQPEANPPPLPQTGYRDAGVAAQAEHGEFAGVRGYQAGDAMKHLAWKQIARLDSAPGAPLISKQFAGLAGGELTLDFAKLPRQLDTELKLSRMTSWILQAEQAQQAYAFRLGVHAYSAALGAAHRDACLRALALHES
ncbi:MULTISPECIES: DUF58 domain-containing protein [unclassified Undibacterium]|uniref:DUF58 domain-containing protein n=1 Tax=unclassified Undibacterium TaxID=2630295 RepID=UPI002AC8ED58|nr:MULTISPECIES: DUF58 domain-containing protein [unclassified Undibacterium]MEB0139568.1 DUF58 domain-containing protein [Undibacterium sp. CCC2.1]MEB0172501.1 DUF58 domain-containing protein [Undibacterium sp. CCC1.1]MEB0176519.1 DUF58 domain-containing protein [Undibacterium sp. CCC3.4]MEB0215627.1 DUF58 domain-containing protein [Undibacterium sp. 5I2]WPX43976.1 DUF58 domain-containing protein [Undibacterium sp. CCC3.4]